MAQSNYPTQIVRKHFRTIIISDVHLGTAGAKAREVVKFLKHNTCDKLILNGDIIDAWELKKYGKWKVKHTRFFKVILKMMEDHGTELVYLHGNHDDFLDTILPLKIGKFSLLMDYILESGEKRYYIVHGDIFDSVTSNLKWIAKLGSLGYNLLLWLNKGFNFWRKKMGKAPYSFSQKIKSKVKSAVSPTSSYEKQLTSLAKMKKCQGIICGHTHKPAMKKLGEIEYMNSGDWVESLTALTEDFEGNWKLFEYYKHPEYEQMQDEKIVLKEEEEIDKMEEFDLKDVLNKVGNLS